MHFEDCELNGAVYDGDVEANALTYNGDGLAYNTEGLQIQTATDEVLNLTGSAYRALEMPDIWSNTPTWSFTGNAISIADSEGTVTVSDATTSFSAGYYNRETVFFDASLSGDFTLQSVLTSDLPVLVSTPEQLL